MNRENTINQGNKRGGWMDIYRNLLTVSIILELKPDGCKNVRRDNNGSFEHEERDVQCSMFWQKPCKIG